jgi:glucose dehydrogenase
MEDRGTIASTGKPAVRASGVHDGGESRANSDRSQNMRSLDTNPYREDKMARLMPASGYVLAVAGAISLWGAQAMANDDLLQLQKDPKQWVMPLGNYAGNRYSELDQINKDNVKDLQVAWTFSTGVLRGHEGGPLVIGDMMYVHAPFRSTSARTARSSGNTSRSRIPTSSP